MDSETTDFYELLAKLRDFHAGIVDALDAYIQTKNKAVLKEYDPEKIQWTNATGAKGPFQRTDDVNNPEYKALSMDLKEHGGFLTYKAYRYWQFENSITIGRRAKTQ